MIKGKKVGLRAVEKQDLPFLRDWRNIVEFRKNFREARELSLTDQEAWFDHLQKTKHINYMFTIIDLDTKKPVPDAAATILLSSGLVLGVCFFGFSAT